MQLRSSLRILIIYVKTCYERVADLTLDIQSAKTVLIESVKSYYSENN